MRFGNNFTLILELESDPGKIQAEYLYKDYHPLHDAVSFKIGCAVSIGPKILSGVF